LDGKRILEIGCGRGGFACWLSRNYPTALITAADFSEAAIRQASDYAGNEGIRNIEWKVEDIQAISLAENSFDVVISCETVEHLPQPAVALRELARVLNPGGYLLLTTPNYLNLLGLYRAYLRVTGRRFTEVGQPVNRFTTLPRTFRWCAQAGLKIVSWDAAGHYIPFPGRPPIQVDIAMNRPVLRWFGQHSLILAQKQQIS
jgi:2-polyprenyl-3-methyl-5-hydroxy-6-metoxy-1,4-benzoquinol methylase